MCVPVCCFSRTCRRLPPLRVGWIPALGLAFGHFCSSCVGSLLCVRACVRVCVFCVVCLNVSFRAFVLLNMHGWGCRPFPPRSPSASPCSRRRCQRFARATLERTTDSDICDRNYHSLALSSCTYPNVCFALCCLAPGGY